MRGIEDIEKTMSIYEGISKEDLGQFKDPLVSLEAKTLELINMVIIETAKIKEKKEEENKSSPSCYLINNNINSINIAFKT